MGRLPSPRSVLLISLLVLLQLVSMRVEWEVPGLCNPYSWTEEAWFVAVCHRSVRVSDTPGISVIVLWFSISSSKRTHLLHSATLTDHETHKDNRLFMKQVGWFGYSKQFARQHLVPQGLEHGRPRKIFFSTSLIAVKNLVVLRHTVWAYVGGPKHLDCWAPLPWYRDRA